MPITPCREDRLVDAASVTTTASRVTQTHFPEVSKQLSENNDFQLLLAHTNSEVVT